MKLTPKQKAFADNYIKNSNGKDAAKKAGYKGNDATLAVIAAENLTKPNISAYIAERMERQEQELVASADEVLQFFTSVMRGKVKDQFDLDASLQDRLNAAKELMKRYAAGGYQPNKEKAEDDALTKALKEEAERMQNAD